MEISSSRLNASRLPITSSWFKSLLPEGRLGAYILVVGLVGIGVSSFAIANLPLEQPLILTALCVLIFVMEWAPIKLTGTPLQGHNLSAGAAVAFAALLILGPAGAVSVRIGSALAYWNKQKRPFYKRLFTISALVVSSAVAGIVYILAGGKFPLVPDLTNLMAACLAAGVYFLSDTTLISGAVSLESHRPFRTVFGNWGWLFLEVLTTLAVGLGMALAYTSGYGSAGFMVVAMFLVLPWYSAHFFVQNTRQIAVQTTQLKDLNAQLQVANLSLDKHLEGLHALQKIGLSINSTQTLPDILQQILDSVVSLIAAHASAIFLETPGKELEIAGQIGLTPGYLKHPELALNGSAHRALRENRRLVMDKNNFQRAMLSAAAAREGILAAACLPLIVSGETVGIWDVCFKSEHTFTENEIELLVALAEQAAVAIQNGRLTEQLHDTYLSTIRALAATVEAKDTYTRGHSEIVRKLAIATGRRLGLSARELELLSVAALFHDLGKVGIPESILNKPGPLNDEEWALMRQHPVIGQQILSQVPALADVHRIVRHHQERYDGNGYPDGICAEQDTLAAIISVADTYQSIVSDRPYRKAQSSKAAIEEIQHVSSSQLVPDVVNAFISVIESGEVDQMRGYQFEPGLLLKTKRADGVLH